MLIQDYRSREIVSRHFAVMITAVRLEEETEALHGAGVRPSNGGSENHVPGDRKLVQRTAGRHLRRGDARITRYYRGFYWNAENQEGPELLQGLAVPATLETDCRAVHQESACRKHAQAEQVDNCLHRWHLCKLVRKLRSPISGCSLLVIFIMPSRVVPYVASPETNAMELKYENLESTRTLMIKIC